LGLAKETQMSTYELASLIIQGTVGVAVVATFVVYFHQLRTMQNQLSATRESSVAQNILAVVNFLQAEDVRAARTIVRRELRSKAMEDWNESEREAASRVCATYDVAAVLLREKLVPLGPFVENWGPSIADCHQILLPFIRKMQEPANSGPSYWDDFGWLYAQVIARRSEAQPCCVGDAAR
jgi:hypothetical protein